MFREEIGIVHFCKLFVYYTIILAAKVSRTLWSVVSAFFGETALSGTSDGYVR
jgi:hypothetical protein